MFGLSSTLISLVHATLIFDQKGQNLGHVLASGTCLLDHLWTAGAPLPMPRHIKIMSWMCSIKGTSEGSYSVLGLSRREA